MLREFKVDNFKCFKEFKIENLGRINIFLGSNNVGKSTLLEAIFGYACGKNLTPLLENTILRMGRNRNQNIYNLIEKSLNTFNNKQNLEFSFEGKHDNKNLNTKFNYKLKPGTRFGEIEAELNPNYFIQQNETNNPTELLFNIEVFENNVRAKEESVFYPPINNYGMLAAEAPFIVANYLNVSNFKELAGLVRIYSMLKRENSLKSIVEELNKAFHNEIEDIDMLPYPDGSQAPISIKTLEGKYIPIYEYGDGMQKWFSMIGNQIIYKNSLHCIDEIGDMLHPEAQGFLGLNLSELAVKHNNQIFATTQSLEFVENYLKYLLDIKKEYLDEIRIITLKNIKGNIKARVLTGENALELLIENSVELR
ncbi:MAG: AAA family ATPase [Cetobacterium sp.]